MTERLSFRCPRVLVLPLLIALLAGAAPYHSLAADIYPQEVWLGMYMGQARIGHTFIRSERSEYNGKPAIRTLSRSKTQMFVLGTEMSQDIEATIFSDSNEKPLFQEFRIVSGNKESHVRVTFKPRSLTYTLNASGSTVSKEIPIPTNAVLVGDTHMPVAGEELKIGQTYTRMAFNPLTLTLDDIRIKVLREETVELDGEKLNCVVIQTSTPLTDLVSWVARPSGMPVRIEASMGLMMIREAGPESARNTYQPPKDFAVLTSVPANIDLPSSSKLKYLEVKLSGIPSAEFVLEDRRQKVPGGWREGQPVTFQITATQHARGLTANLPFSRDAFPRDLGDDPYIQPAAPQIVEQAAAIVKQERNAYAAASLIRKWVHDSMKSESTMGVLRPSTDVLANRTGVCRDYAVLYAALARASGIPTRMVGGLIFSKGDFYYHAWNEIWTGSQWVPMDATLPEDFVSAAHIKLTEGSATEIYRLARIVGQLRAEIVSYR